MMTRFGSRYPFRPSFAHRPYMSLRSLPSVRRHSFPLHALALLTILLAAPLASAHGDRSSLEAVLTIPAGESYSFNRSVHWHRVLGHVDASGPVEFMANGQRVAGPNAALTINHLVRCCDALWTEVPFALHNPGSSAVTVRVEMAFLHDNLAVLADDAEPGGWWQTLLILLVGLGVPAFLVRQPREGDAVRWLRASRVLHGGAWVAAGAMSVVGMVRFGGGPIVGNLAATASLPGAFGPLFNTHSLLMLGLMALWISGYAFLAGARRRGHDGWQDGAVYAVGPLVVGTSMFLELGGFWIVVGLAVVPAFLVCADQWGRQWAARGSADHSMP